MVIPLVVTLSFFTSCKPGMAELQEIEKETIELMESLRQPYETEINSYSGKVEVYVPDVYRLGKALDEAGKRLPEKVTAIERIPPPEGLNPDPSVHFPQFIVRPVTYMTADFTGNLELKNGYLYAGEHIIIWLPGYFVHNNNGTIEVWDRDGTVVGRVGEPISMGGGISELGNYILLLKEPLSPEADGPFWFQAGARMSLNFESDYFNLEIIDYNNQSYSFVTMKKPLEETGGRHYPVAGTLAAGGQYGCRCACIVVFDESDSTTIIGQYTPLWPSDFTARVENGVLQIMDGNGVVVARDGEEITVEAIKVTNNYNELFTRLRNEMPGECFYTNLLVERVIQGEAGKRLSEESTPVTFDETGRQTPEEILSGLPVYPGSVPVENPPPEENPSEPAASSNETVRYRTASAKYEVDADLDDLIDWYEGYFKESGFHFKTGFTTGKSFGEVTGRGLTYWLPAQPAVSVEVTARPKDDPSSSVYELLVSEDLRIARPYDENLIPSDIERIDIEYRGWEPVTVTGEADIEALTGLVNTLPLDPEYARFGPLPEPDIIEFSLAFHSASQGTITLFERNNQVYIEGHPVLWDTHALLMRKVREIGQIEETP